jgi:hypothetical protein
MVAASWARRVGAAASPRSYRVQAHKQICVCPHVEEVHARKWKIDAPTQDTTVACPSGYGWAQDSGRTEHLAHEAVSVAPDTIPT